MDQEREIDEFVGKKVSSRRKNINLTQKYVANKLDISFQQLQKYERGINRIGASKLFKLAEILNVDVSYFFEGYGDNQAPESMIQDFRKKLPSDGAQEVTLEILEHLAKLSAKARGNLLDLLKSLTVAA